MPAVPTIEGAGRERLREQLGALGFDEVRFVRLEPLEAGGLRAWIEAGRHAEMAWMERTVEKRTDPGLVLAGARSAILLGVNYWRQGDPAAASGHPRWARYALHEDYHDTIKPGLAAAGALLERDWGLGPADYRYYVDTGPVLERGWAARSGLGFRGKNAMLISPRHGNWLFLASVLTRLDIEPDAPLRPDAARPGKEEPAGLLCGKCRRCLEACPTDAFPEPGVVDARRCVSYQTIENKGAIPRELRPGIGHRVYGCDVCLEVCPWNRFAQAGRQTLLVARHDLAHLTLGDLLEMTPGRFAETFRRTAVKRLKLTGLLRNACVVAGNSGDTALLPRVVALARHESPLVRAHAVWAVRRLAGSGAVEMLAAAREAEQDPVVLAEYDAAELPKML